MYLLRGLIRCDNCGLAYCGATGRTGPRKARNREIRLYRCIGITSNSRPDRATRCHGRQIRADAIEAGVWEQCKQFITNPGEHLADAQRQLRGRMEESAGLEERRRSLIAQLAEKDGERKRVLTMYRRNRITADEADRELDAITREAATVRELLESLRAQDALIAAAEVHLMNTATMLTQLQDRVEEIDRTNDVDGKRSIIELLVSRITVRTEGEGKDRHAQVTVRYAFRQDDGAVVASAMGPGG